MSECTSYMYFSLIFYLFDISYVYIKYIHKHKSPTCRDADNHIFCELQSLTITYSECDLRSLTITWSEPFENMIYNHSQSWLVIISDRSKKIAPIFLRRILKGLAPFFTILLWRILKGLAPIYYHFVVENF